VPLGLAFPAPWADSRCCPTIVLVTKRSVSRPISPALFAAGIGLETKRALQETSCEPSRWVSGFSSSKVLAGPLCRSILVISVRRSINVKRWAGDELGMAAGPARSSHPCF